MAHARPVPSDVLEVLGLPRDAEVQPAPGGASGTAWLVASHGSRWIVRLEGSQRTADGRVAAMTAARAGGLPAPEVLARAASERGVAVALAYLPGRSLLELMLGDPRSAVDWARRMGQLQRRLHEVPAPAPVPTLTGDGGHPFGAGPADEPIPAGDTLLHLDWHPGNLLGDPASGRISGILDWDNAHRGHPLLDLARTESMLVVEPGLGRLPAEARDRLAAVRVAWADGYGPEAFAIPDVFRRWAGRVMIADLTDRYAQEPELLEPARRWAAGVEA